MAFTRKVLYGLKESLASLTATIQSWANGRFSLLGHTHNYQSPITKYVRSYNGSTGVSDVTGVSKISVNGGTVASPNAAGLVDLTIYIPSMPDINYPVTKVNGLTGDVVITLASLGGVTASQCVTSYNGNKGAVTGVSVIKINGSTLSPSNGIVDLGTIQVSPTEVPVQSVNGRIGAVTVTKSDILPLYATDVTWTNGSTYTVLSKVTEIYSDYNAHRNNTSIHFPITSVVSSVGGKTGDIKIRLNGADIAANSEGRIDLGTVVTSVVTGVTSLNGSAGARYAIEKLSVNGVSVTATSANNGTLSMNIGIGVQTVNGVGIDSSGNCTLNGSSINFSSVDTRKINVVVDDIFGRLTSGSDPGHKHSATTVIHSGGSTVDSLLSDYLDHKNTADIHVSAASRGCWDHAYTLVNTHMPDLVAHVNTPDCHVSAADRQYWTDIDILRQSHANDTSIHTSAAEKQKINNAFGAPNYAAGQASSLNTVYTAASNGWLVVNGKDYDSGHTVVYIDGVAVISTQGPNYDGTIDCCLPIANGSSYQVIHSGRGAVNSIVFYPCI